MDWIKIKTKHILNTRFTLLEVGALVTLEALTGHLERVPDEFEIAGLVPQRTCEAIASKLQRQRTTIAEVLHKVCEDVARASHQSRKNVAKVQDWRNDKEKDTLVTGNVTSIDKIRVDKIRVDKNKEKEKVNFLLPNENDFNEIWETYPKKEGKGEALRYFKRDIKTFDDLDKLKIATKKYMEYIKIQEKEFKYIKMGSTFFNSWREWFDYDLSEINIKKSKHEETRDVLREGHARGPNGNGRVGSEEIARTTKLLGLPDNFI